MDQSNTPKSTSFANIDVTNIYIPIQKLRTSNADFSAISAKYVTRICQHCGLSYAFLLTYRYRPVAVSGISFFPPRPTIFIFDSYSESELYLIDPYEHSNSGTTSESKTTVPILLIIWSDMQRTFVLF